MLVRWHGQCGLPVTLWQLPVGRRGSSPQTQARCVAQFRMTQGCLHTRTSFLDLAGIRSLHVVAARKYDGPSKTCAFVAPQSSLKTPPESAITDHAQRDPESGASLMPKNLEATIEATRPSSMDLASQLKRKESRFAIQERGKENRLLVNQLLKDKGRLSYDWRVPVELLEHHYQFPNAQTPNPDISLFRKAVPSDDTASGHQGASRIQRIKTRIQKQAKLARDIVIPSVWSETALAIYVEDLVEYEYRKDAVSRVWQLADKGSSNIADITTALNGIFTSPTTKRYLSIQAYTTALRFFYDNGLFSDARALYIQIEDSRLNIPTEIFNLVLRGSASSRDLHNFTFILQKCIQRGFKPDIETWNILLTTISSSEVRAVIIQRMRERGILDSLPEKGNALRLIVQHEIGSHIDKIADRGAFLDHMDECYGKTWLTTSTGNKLLYEFGKRRSMSETLNLLPSMKLREWRPDEISLDTLLRQSLLLRQHKYSIEILENFRYHFRVEPAKQAHETLFLLAWRSHLLNFARVVWASACTCGHVTFKMQNFVFQSLLSKAALQPSDGSSERFKKLAGAFVVGVNKSKEMMSPGLGGTSEAQGPVTRRSIVKYAQILLQSDLSAAGSPRIQEDLGKLLLQALELDTEWVATKFLDAADLQQVLQSGIQIRRETQKAMVIRKIGSFPRTQEPTRSVTRPDHAESFQQMKHVRVRQVRGVRLHRQVVSPAAKAPSRRHIPIRNQMARGTQKTGVTPKLGESVKLRKSLNASTRLRYVRTFRNSKVDNLEEVGVKQTRRQAGAPNAKASSATAESLKGSCAPAVGTNVTPLNLRYVQSTERIVRTLAVIHQWPISKTLRKPIASPSKQKHPARLSTRKHSVDSIRHKLLKRNLIAGPSKQKHPARLSTRKQSVRSVRRKLLKRKPLIRNHPSGDASLKVSTDLSVRHPPLFPAVRKLSPGFVENDPTFRPLIRKPLAVREEPILHPIRKHLATVYKKHTVPPGVRKASLDLDGKTLSAPLKNAHIHSSLDAVLGLSEALHEGARSNNPKAEGGETASSRDLLADQDASSSQEALATVKLRRCLPRRRPYIQRRNRGFL